MARRDALAFVNGMVFGTFAVGAHVGVVDNITAALFLGSTTGLFMAHRRAVNGDA